MKKGYSWDQALSPEATDSTRYCKRGIGPAKQAATFSGGLEAVVAAEVPNTVPLVAGGPVGMISLVVIAVFFLLREIEAALMLRKSVTINRTRKTVRIRLSASKTDPMALSVTREWGCVCPPDGSAAGSHYSSVPPCPYCAAVAQAEIVSAVARENGMDAEDVPFFPTASGNAANEDHVVALVEQMANALGDTVRDESGRRKFTGHTFRGQGAQPLAAMGLELFKIRSWPDWPHRS